jgi:hypothetical protein
VLDGELNTNDLVFVDKDNLVTAKDSYADSYIQSDDILITRTGAKAGATCIVRELDRPFIVSSHSIRIIPNKELVYPKYLELFLLSRWGKSQINRLFTGAAQKQLQLATVSKLVIPLPPLAVQHALVDEMEVARNARQRNLAGADELLRSLDRWLLMQLGLELPRVDERKVFAVSLGDTARTSRLNADYFHPERVLTIRAMQTHKERFDSQPLSAVVDFVRNLRRTPTGTYLSLAHVQGNTGELVESNETAEGSCLAFAENDVLFARLRPYLNKVYRAEMSGVCSPEFHVLRIKDMTRLKPDYLASILRSSLILAQTRHMMTGNTHPRLTNDDVVNLVIPIPSTAIQELVAAEVRRRRQNARRMRQEAETEWDRAKARFEEKLLKGESS